MNTNLSPSAVMALRFEIRGWRSKVARPDAYRELAEAGIMELVPGSVSEYRFTADGLAHREEILGREETRIERDRHEPPVREISESARECLRAHLTGDQSVTEENRPAYRELVAARIMIPVSGFATGPESSFRFTYWGWARRREWIALPVGSP